MHSPAKLKHVEVSSSPPHTPSAYRKSWQQVTDVPVGHLSLSLPVIQTPDALHCCINGIN